MNNALYENIISGIAKSVKKAINERIDPEKFYECLQPMYFGDFIIEYNKEGSKYKRYVAKEVLDFVIGKCPKVVGDINGGERWYIFYGTSNPSDNIIDDKELHSSLKRSKKVTELQTLGIGEGSWGVFVYNSGIYAYQGHLTKGTNNSSFSQENDWVIIAPESWWKRKGLLI